MGAGRDVTGVQFNAGLHYHEDLYKKARQYIDILEKGQIFHFM
jgi:hypothetical protein